MKEYTHNGRLWRYLLLLMAVSWHGLFLFGQAADPSEGGLISLKAFIGELSKEHNVEFAFDPEEADRVYIEQPTETANLEDCLMTGLAQTNFMFRRASERRFLIGPKDVKEFHELPVMISGIIHDNASGEPLEFAHIQCIENGEVAVTDQTGLFAILFPQLVDTASFNVSFVGFKDQMLKMSKSDLRSISVAMESSYESIENVEVVERIPAINTLSNYHSWRFGSDSDLPQFSILGTPDIMRSIQYLPGIDATNDASVGISVRGSTSEETLIMMDGITLFNPCHLFGIFSAVNAGTVRSFDVYKNNLPVYSGGYTGGMVEIHAHEHSSDPVDLLANLNTMASDFTLQLNPGKRVFFMVSGRSSMGDLGESDLYQVGNSSSITVENFTDSQVREQIIGVTPVYNFYDGVAKFGWQISPHVSFSTTAYKGQDDFEYQYAYNFSNRNNNNKVDNQEVFLESGSWGHEGLRTKFDIDWSTKVRTEISWAASHYNQTDNLESTLYRIKPMRKDTHAVTHYYSNQVDQDEVLLVNNVSLKNKTEITFGLQYTDIDLDLLIRNDRRDILTDGLTSHAVTGFAGLQFQLTPKTSLRMDSRMTYYEGADTWRGEPRFTLTQWAGTRSKFKASWGRHLQYLAQQTHENRLGRNIEFWILADGKRTPIAYADHSMIGYAYSSSGFELDVEVFYHQTTGITDHALVTPGFRDNNSGPPRNDKYETFKGNRKSYGIDVFLRYESKNWSNWVSYTLSRTKERFKQLNRGAWYPSEMDRRHQVNLLSNYRLKNWTFGLSYVYGSGRPYLDYSLLEFIMSITDDQNRTKVKESEYIRRLPDYHRLDISVAYDGQLSESVQWQLKGSLFNVFDHDNVSYRQYIYNLPDNSNNDSRNSVIGTEVGLLGFTPNVNLALRF